MHVVDELTCRISSVETLSGNVLRIMLELAREGFIYRAGQYIDLLSLTKHMTTNNDLARYPIIGLIGGGLHEKEDGRGVL